MPKSIDVVQGNYSSGGENKPPVAFLRKIVADQKQGYVIDRPECDLDIAGTINIDGASLIKKIECRTPNCDSTECVFNRK
ncbi:MAG: hypothetical protein US68_C0008G0086 [Candidatus Shapirobacteria bacterium GW2011_GWE1_38_10]|uniref:Uncharacterized protein n=1 Tax=Candidatus Shapirobacteria bacterium GW2011_GWE1_38_10 TaxID=1618488 RepID=A0A0G0LC45_9BACT|nr:MAG: hypothetical protein US46_C0006G0059 [Candidatus Shapirobacteria bacterium GW2011_GWF2_37_20]KKQ50201.1 MAG: hypothetical protein US68_C0008G0086 [Candidatus Shapirobacteria bacterium GW2011_GWE1_38_10]KKQ63781.1 MAG: hypothetical protein US85_C0014G0013 [Candidatus Shapirobacteria bacterium GW2011_GWF1_38_23]